MQYCYNYFFNFIKLIYETPNTKHQTPNTKLNLAANFKPYLLLICLSFFLFNCDTGEVIEEVSVIENEEIYLEESNTPSDLLAQRISLEQLQQNQDLSKTIESISNLFDINNTKKEDRNYERVDATDGSFVILTEEILQVSTDSTTVYTFKIETPTDPSSSFENFAIDISNDSIIRFYIYKYFYNETSEDDFKYTYSYSEVDENIVDITSFDGFLSRVDEGGCSVTYFCQLCSNGWCHDDGSPCAVNGSTSIYYVSCIGGGGPGNPSGGDADTGDDTSSGGDGSEGGGGVPADTSNTGDDSEDSPSTTGVLPPTRAQILTSLLGELTEEQIEWANSGLNRTAAEQLINYLQSCGTFVAQRIGNCVVDAGFALLAFDASMEGDEVDYNELYIETKTPDDVFVLQTPTQLISNPLLLSNGDLISIQFGVTISDNISANQLVSTDLIDGLKFALEQANSNLPVVDKITDIYIMATTNGNHSATSNHTNGTAIDISRINGKKMFTTGVTNQIIELQNAFDSYTYIRENFGPSFKHKFDLNTNTWNYNYPIGGHSDHIHISVRR
ncbi:MAG: hypothetical protein COB73_01595 [Flavobacteriaceae bacterium]|nr:MAG: hypothetical protein COB73_01595 [Flavobacteriaceae bacterium]